MPYNVIMPKAGMAMEEGTIVRWLKKVGDVVSKGEAIAVIETDKVTMDLESDFEGTLLAITHGDGEVVRATETIAWIGRPGETVEAPHGSNTGAPQAAESAAHAIAATPQVAASAARAIAATPAARAFAAREGVALDSVRGSGPGGAVRLRDLQRSREVRATPLARRVAALENVDLAGVEGSGAGGRIRKADVESSARDRPGAPAPTAPGSPIAFTSMRRAIAEKMLHSHQQVPAVTLVTRADVTELAALRERMNASGKERISYTDFVVRAAALALREHPLINSTLEGERVILREEVNIGIAVALENGLIVPVVRGADGAGLRQIAAASRNLAERARAGTLTPGECAGGTFTVTNLGMYGITEFTPIINVPESAILGVGAVEEGFRTGPAGIEARRLMSLCLTHDHRHIDGAPAAAFLGRVRSLLENCYALIG